MKSLIFRKVGFVFTVLVMCMFACTNVNPKVAEEAESRATSKLPRVTTWHFDSFKCPLLKNFPIDSVAEQVEWFSFALTSKRVFSINSNTLIERLYPQGDHSIYQAGLDTLAGKKTGSVRYVYRSPYATDSLLSPVKISDCKWWYKKTGNYIIGYKTEGETTTAVLYSIGATAFLTSFYENGHWARESIRLYNGEQKSNISSVLQAISLSKK